MKKYLVIGKPIKHSLSPALHNHWIKQNNLKAIYQKKQLNKNDLKKIIAELKDGVVHGINVTVPYKKLVIPYLDELSPLAEKSQSVNTILKKNNKIFGENTDIGGFQNALNHINYSIKNKRVFILGAGGVVPSIIIALKNLNVSKIFLSNRTKSKAENLKKIEPNLEIIDWGHITDFDMIINATSLGLKSDDKIKLDYDKIGTNKLFYDVIYNPAKTNFLLRGEQLGNKIENGKMMFIYQAQLAFKTWHNILPKIDNKLLD
ncbi:MAG TPA: shikimate dehydrogenase [Candidatus Pelagibacter sp.]|jgi:shikimate dehydrogenase|nr:shikimate dehydrogenase [Candidatus Pelagibacter sp.]